MGVGRFFRDHRPSVQLVSVQPDTPLHGLEGLKHMESALVPGIYDPSLADVDMRVSTEEAYDTTRRLAVEEGLLVGISSGAAAAAGVRIARTVDQAVIVMIFFDGEAPGGVVGLFRRHAHVDIGKRRVVDARHQRRLHVLEPLEPVQRRIRLHGDELHRRTVVAEEAADAHERAARAESRDEVGHAAAGLRQDLRRGRVVVRVPSSPGRCTGP